MTGKYTSIVRYFLSAFWRPRILAWHTPITQAMHHSSNALPARPFQARIRRRTKLDHLGSFATAEEAALAYARASRSQVGEAKHSCIKQQKQWDQRQKHPVHAFSNVQSRAASARTTPSSTPSLTIMDHMSSVDNDSNIGSAAMNGMPCSTSRQGEGPEPSANKGLVEGHRLLLHGLPSTSSPLNMAPFSAKTLSAAAHLAIAASSLCSAIAAAHSARDAPT